MIWQDIVISAVSFAFAFMLIPQMRDSFKGKGYVNIYTASFTSVGLVIIAVMMLTLELWFSGFSAFVTCTMWIVLFGLSYKNHLVSKV